MVMIDDGDVIEYPIYLTYFLYACFRESGRPVFVTTVNGVKIKCMVLGQLRIEKERSIKETSTMDLGAIVMIMMIMMMMMMMMMMTIMMSMIHYLVTL